MVAGSGNDVLENSLSMERCTCLILWERQRPIRPEWVRSSFRSLPAQRSATVARDDRRGRMADNYAEAAGVPEPFTILLGSLGLLGLFSAVRRGHRRRM